ncbi:MAG: hypothetical protein IKL89_04230 [Clostridia bacterium]|nr:hypothetical protein [Clostridia bacterium]
MYLREVFLRHAAAYPAAQPEDFLKICYQGEFGAGHLLRSPEAARQDLFCEYASAAAEGSLLEDVGGAYRLHLGPARAAGLPPEALWVLFSAARPRGCEEGLRARTAALRELAAEGLLPFGADALSAALARWQAAGYPPMRHSAPFRAKYRPAYRVIDAEEARLLPLLCRIAAEKPRVVAIDGRCGSGKTSVAATLAEVFRAPTVHMDDFFLPPALRGAERLAEPGGNVHYERFAAEVLPGLSSGCAFSYRIFSCARMDFDGVREIPAAPLRIVEGSYSHHPHFGDYADLRVFVTAERGTRLARIAARDGESYLPAFREKWIPLEEAAFAAFATEQAADIRIETDQFPKF